MFLTFNAKAQEVSFFHEINCSATKKNIGHDIKINFFQKTPLIKFYEYEKSKNKSIKKSDMFPAKSLEAQIFLSQKYCQFHVISRRPSVNSFHFVMNVQNFTSKDVHIYEGPAHFNFLIDEIYPVAKEHKLVQCSISGLTIPGYYYHSCKKQKEKKKKPKLIIPTKNNPNLPYYRDLNNNGIQDNPLNNNSGTQ